MTLQDSKKGDTGKYFSSSQVVNMKRWKFKKYSKKKKIVKRLYLLSYLVQREMCLWNFKHPWVSSIQTALNLNQQESNLFLVSAGDTFHYDVGE